MADRVAVVTVVTGTGPASLGVARPGYQTFAAGLGDGPCYYGLIDDVTGEWEVGIGTLSAGGLTLTRDTCLSSSNGGAFVAFAAGDKTAYCPEPAFNKNLDMGNY
jgi:hypothetical protein